MGIFPITRGAVEDLWSLNTFLTPPMAPAPAREGPCQHGARAPRGTLNSILVVSPRAAYIDTVGRWVEQLDDIDEPASEATLHVYDVVNGNAGQMAMLLSTIFGESGGGGAKGQRPQSQVAPGMASQRSGGAGNMPGTGAGQSMGGSSFELGESIRVVSDDYNNALLVYASPYEYSKIGLLKKLDVVATQVLIEASIVGFPPMG